MPVYLIRAGATGPVKIGKADNPKARLGELQVGHYETLTLLRVWEGGEVEEAALHVRFADLNIRGEWFAFSRLMLTDLGLLEKPELAGQPPIKVPHSGKPTSAKDIVRALGGPSRLAARLGTSVSAVSNWSLEGIPGRLWPTLARIAAEMKAADITLEVIEAHTRQPETAA